MNILVLSWRGPGHPLSGGAEQVTWQHMLGWTSKGSSVTLFTSSYKGCKQNETIQNINVVREGDQFIGVKLAAFKWFLRHKGEFDLIVDEHHGIPFFTPLYSNHKKLVLIHEVASHVWALNPWPRPINLLPKYLGPVFERIILKFLYKNYPFMTVSESTKNDLISIGCKNVTVIENGVIKPEKRVILKKSKTPSVIYLSALAKDKGIEDAIEVFRILDTKFKNIFFNIVGKGHPEYEKFLRLKADNYLKNKNYRFHGYVSNQQKFNLLAQSHILINCSFHEGWGLVNIEANLMGTPVVGYYVSGTKDSIVDGYNGLISKNINPESIAELVVKLLSNKDLYDKLSRQCIQYSKKFTWERSKSESYKLICSL